MCAHFTRTGGSEFEFPRIRDRIWLSKNVPLARLSICLDFVRVETAIGIRFARLLFLSGILGCFLVWRLIVEMFSYFLKPDFPGGGRLVLEGARFRSVSLAMQPELGLQFRLATRAPTFYVVLAWVGAIMEFLAWRVLALHLVCRAVWVLALRWLLLVVLKLYLHDWRRCSLF